MIVGPFHAFLKGPIFRIKTTNMVPWTKSVDFWYLDIYEHTAFVCARCQVLTLKKCQEMLQLSYQILGMFGYVHYFKIHGFLPKNPRLYNQPHGVRRRHLTPELHRRCLIIPQECRHAAGLQIMNIKMYVL